MMSNSLIFLYVLGAIAIILFAINFLLWICIKFRNSPILTPKVKKDATKDDGNIVNILSDKDIEKMAQGFFNYEARTFNYRIDDVRVETSIFQHDKEFGYLVKCKLLSVIDMWKMPDPSLFIMQTSLKQK